MLHTRRRWQPVKGEGRGLEKAVAAGDAEGNKSRTCPAQRLLILRPSAAHAIHAPRRRLRRAHRAQTCPIVRPLLLGDQPATAGLLALRKSNFLSLLTRTD
jgi:hypothetical protein